MPRSSMNERQQHEPTFFVDQNLCGIFAARLRLSGLRVEELSSHLPGNTPDVEWIPFAAERGWVALTMDQLRADPEEELALMLHGIRVFVFLGKASHPERAEMFLRKLRWVRRTLTTYKDPFMARISMATGGHHIVTLADLMNRQARRRR
jgi:hypothetical protein